MLRLPAVSPFSQLLHSSIPCLPGRFRGRLSLVGRGAHWRQLGLSPLLRNVTRFRLRRLGGIRTVFPSAVTNSPGITHGVCISQAEESLTRHRSVPPAGSSSTALYLARRGGFSVLQSPPGFFADSSAASKGTAPTAPTGAPTQTRLHSSMEVAPLGAGQALGPGISKAAAQHLPVASLLLLRCPLQRRHSQHLPPRCRTSIFSSC